MVASDTTTIREGAIRCRNAQRERTVTLAVSIIICTRNRSQATKETLAAFSRLSFPVGGAEVLVVDNGSTDDTAEVVAGSRIEGIAVRYLREPQVGKAKALNLAMREAQGEVILFCDDDIRPPADWVKRMCGPLLEGKADAAVGGIHLAPHLDTAEIKPFKGWLACTDTWDNPNPTCMCGGNMAVSRRVLEKVPSFDTELGPGALGSGEESLFSYQVEAAGFRIVSALDVVVEHHCDVERMDRVRFLDYAERRGRSEAYVDYHWSHTPHRFARAKLWRAELGLFLWRAGHRRPSGRFGITAQEVEKVRSLFFWRQHLLERRRPHNYERRGLVKLSHE